jgi:hypothetical protein
MYEYKRATRLFSEACSPVNGVEVDLFPWLRFLPHKPLRKLTEARALLDHIVNGELARVKVVYPFLSRHGLFNDLLQSATVAHIADLLFDSICLYDTFESPACCAER